MDDKQWNADFWRRFDARQAKIEAGQREHREWMRRQGYDVPEPSSGCGCLVWPAAVLVLVVLSLVVCCGSGGLLQRGGKCHDVDFSVCFYRVVSDLA